MASNLNPIPGAAIVLFAGAASLIAGFVMTTIARNQSSDQDRNVASAVPAPAVAKSLNQGLERSEQEAREREAEAAHNRGRAAAAAQEARERAAQEARDRERAAAQEARDRADREARERRRAEEAAQEAHFRAQIPDYRSPPWSQLQGSQGRRQNGIFDDCRARLGNSREVHSFCWNQAVVGAGPGD